MGQGEDTVLAFCRVRSSRTEIILISLPAGQGRLATESKWTAISEHSEPSVARRIFIAFDEAGDRGDEFRTYLLKGRGAEHGLCDAAEKKSGNSTESARSDHYQVGFPFTSNIRNHLFRIPQLNVRRKLRALGGPVFQLLSAPAF